MAGFKWETAHRARACGHNHCTDCRTRRGSNRGNRRLRQVIRLALRRGEDA